MVESRPSGRTGHHARQEEQVMSPVELLWRERRSQLAHGVSSRRG